MVTLRRKSIVISLVFLFGLLAVTAKKTPIPTGDAEDYWEFACGVELPAFDGYFPYARWRGIFPKTDGWYFYYYQEHHGRHVFKASKEALMKQVPEVYSLLSSEITKTVQNEVRDMNNYIEEKNRRRRECLAIMKSVNGNNDLFLDKVSESRSSASNLKYGQEEIDSFKMQWKRSQIYWASILFEAIFLCFWWLFSFHKGALGKLNKRLDIQIAFSPIILFIPHYLGYAPYLFSSGPSGGILYPLFAMLFSLLFCWLPFNPLEIWLLERLPHPLAYISQVPASPLALSFRGAVSPTVLIGFAVFVLSVSNYWKSKMERKQGQRPIKRD